MRRFFWRRAALIATRAPNGTTGRVVVPFRGTISEEPFAAVAALIRLLAVDPSFLPAVIREDTALNRAPEALHAVDATPIWGGAQEQGLLLRIRRVGAPLVAPRWRDAGKPFGWRD
jgi:hypothetical protein